eukprot:UN01688
MNFDELRSTISIQFGLPKSSFNLYEIVDGDRVEIDDIDDIAAGFDSGSDVKKVRNARGRTIDIFVQVPENDAEGGNLEYVTRCAEESHSKSSSDSSSHTNTLGRNYGRKRSKHIMVGSMNVDIKLDELMNKLHKIRSGSSHYEQQQDELLGHHGGDAFGGSDMDLRVGAELIPLDDEDDAIYDDASNNGSSDKCPATFKCE